VIQIKDPSKEVLKTIFSNSYYLKTIWLSYCSIDTDLIYFLTNYIKYGSDLEAQEDDEPRTKSKQHKSKVKHIGLNNAIITVPVLASYFFEPISKFQSITSFSI
jgi:hypothetical protein